MSSKSIETFHLDSSGGLGGTYLNKLTGVDATRLAGANDIIAKVNAEGTESLTKKIGVDIKISVNIDS